jgi:branched-chain amino acid transport system substrate-binding protein
VTGGKFKAPSAQKEGSVMTGTRNFKTLALSAALALGVSSAALAQTEVKIGMSAPITGPSANFGDSMVKGAQIAIDEEKDFKVSLNIQDDACDAQQGVNAANKLVTDGIDVLVGYHCSGSALPSLPILNKAKIPVVISQALHPSITEQGFRGVFRVISTTAQEAPAATKILMDDYGAKTIALIHDNTAVQKNLMQQTSKLIGEGGGEVVYETAVTPGATEFGVNVAKIMSEKPDAVFLVLYYPEAAHMTKQLLAAGYTGQILQCDAGVDPNFIKIAGEEVAGKTAFVTQPVTSQFAAAKPFIEAYEAKFKEKPGVLAAYTYDAMKVTLAAIRTAGSTDYEKIIEALKGYSGDHVTGKIEFDDNGQLKTGVFTRLVVKNGEFVEP